MNVTRGRTTWGERVRREREARGWTQAELAALVRASRKTIMRIEGGGPVADELRITLADAFGFPPNVLFDLDDLRPDRLRLVTRGTRPASRAS
jgi:transcriptional regulator with XRE-family HTH domain